MVAPAVVVGAEGRGVRFTGEVGYIARERTMFGGMTIDDEVYLRTGIGLALTPNAELASTVSFATAAATPITEARRNYVEVLVGPTVEVADRVTMFAAAGAGLQDAFGTPDWRLLAGMRYQGQR